VLTLSLKCSSEENGEPDLNLLVYPRLRRGGYLSHAPQSYNHVQERVTVPEILFFPIRRETLSGKTSESGRDSHTDQYAVAQALRDQGLSCRLITDCP